MSVKRAASHLMRGDWYGVRRTMLMPEEAVKRRTLRKVQAKYQAKSFVETGTFLGGTARYMSAHVDHCVTIEKDPDLAARAVRLLGAIPNVQCLCGSSSDLLQQVIPELEQPLFFFLDAHYSGGETASGDDPLMDDLQTIAASTVSDSIVVIDDISDYCKASSLIQLPQIFEALLQISPQAAIYFDFDMLICLPSEPRPRQFFRDIAVPFLIR